MDKTDFFPFFFFLIRYGQNRLKKGYRGIIEKHYRVQITSPCRSNLHVRFPSNLSQMKSWLILQNLGIIQKFFSKSSINRLIFKIYIHWQVSIYVLNTYIQHVTLNRGMLSLTNFIYFWSLS